MLFFVAGAPVLTPEEKPAAEPVFSATEKSALGFEGEGWSGVEYVEAPVKEGKKAALWKEHLKNKSIQSAAIPHDWSRFKEVSFWMHSAKKTGEQVIFILNSRKDPKVFSYFSSTITVDWDGWKKVVIPFKKFSPSRDPAGWAKIDSIQIAVDGWGLKPHPESVLVLDGMQFTVGQMPVVERKMKPAMKADPARVKAIAALLPPTPAPVLLFPAKDRAKWLTLPPERLKAMVDAADSKVRAGMMPFSDEDYLDYSRKGKRTGDRMMGSRTSHLNTLVLGECAEYKGRFLPAIAEAVESIAADKSWTLSAHDSKLDNYEGRKVEIDLSSAARGLLFSGALKLLEDVLPEKTKQTLRRELERRIFEPYRTRFVEGRGAFWWMQGDNNWNAVCHAGVVLAALAVLEKAEDRALFINGAEIGAPWFLHGMPDDGYCTEGIGYWGYGFGNYVLLAMGIREATAGKIDWFQNAKVAAIGRFGRRMELINESYPAFADCSPVAKPSDWIVYFMDRLYEPAKLEGWKTRGLPLHYGDPQPACQTLFTAFSLYHTAPAVAAHAVKAGDELRDFFGIAGILNSRPKDPAAPDAFAVSMKGGHNAEEHNHNDVGSFVVSTPLSKPPIILDPGNEVYTARTFSSKRYESKALSSWGHPVPLVGGEQQRPGRDAEAKVVETLFRDEADRIVLDITAPYDEIEGVKEVKRTFVYTRSPKVSLRIEDSLKANKPLSFGTALLTYHRWQQTGPKTLLFFSDKEALEVTIESGDKVPVIKADLIDEDMGYRLKPTRVGINLPGEAPQAQMALVIRRVDRSTLPGGEAANEGRSERLGLHQTEPKGAIHVEAEDFSAQAGGKVELLSKIGASKLSFKGWDDPGHSLTWAFQVPKAGNYAIELRYCGANDVSRLLFLDDKPAGPRTNLFRFAGTGGWSSEKNDWKDVTLCSPTGAIRFPLTAGAHRLTFVGQGGGMNLDWLRFVPATGKDCLNANPSLEDADKDGVPDGWSLSPAPNGKGTRASLSIVDGRSTLSLSDRDKENGLGLQQILPATPGRTYRESARLRGDPIHFYFIWFDKDKKQIGKELIKRMECGKDAFAPFQYEEKAPEGAVAFRFWIYSARGSMGDTQIQEAAVEELGGP
jgi:hypothetical protein